MSKKEKIGIVISDKNSMTRTVAIQTRYPHIRYGKTVLQTKRYMIHDASNSCKSGDIVIIEESAPISRCKSWKLKKVLKFYQGN